MSSTGCEARFVSARRQSVPHHNSIAAQRQVLLSAARKSRDGSQFAEKS
jgi:hypothetical protein